jgi:hypothetical protein
MNKEQEFYGVASAFAETVTNKYLKEDNKGAMFMTFTDGTESTTACSGKLIHIVTLLIGAAHGNEMVKRAIMKAAEIIAIEEMPQGLRDAISRVIQKRNSDHDEEEEE